MYNIYIFSNLYKIEVVFLYLFIYILLLLLLFFFLKKKRILDEYIIK